jgi:hypothetical protein
MGCWNKTCGLSGLHIFAGSPVYVFVLERNKKYDPCYSTGVFTPLLLPFESEYNDYGAGENSSGVALDYIMNSIRDQLVELPQGENPYHDIAVSRDNWGIEQFFEAVHKDRLSIQGRYTEPTELYFTMFRRDVVDAILANREIEDYVGDGKGTGGWGNNYVYYRFADIAASVRPLLEKLQEDIGQLESVWARSMVFDRLRDYREDFLAARWMQYDSYRYSRVVDIKELAYKALDTGTQESLDQFETLLIEHLKAVYLDSFMITVRKSWIPGGHEGSPSADADGYRLLCNTVIACLDAEQEEEEDDDE